MVLERRGVNHRSDDVGVESSGDQEVARSSRAGSLRNVSPRWHLDVSRLFYAPVVFREGTPEDAR
jgi:hypothetical protein